MAIINRLANKDCDLLPSPSQDTTARCSDDQALRTAGFRVFARPKVGPAIWVRKGKLFTLPEALAEVEKDRYVPL